MRGNALTDLLVLYSPDVIRRGKVYDVMVSLRAALLNSSMQGKIEQFVC